MTPHLDEDIQRDEGYAHELPDGRCKAYADPISKGPPWTCGFGSTGAEVKPDTVWTRDEAVASYRAKRDEAIAGLDRHIPWWRSLSDPRQDCLVNMAYNLGVGGLLGFHNTLEAVRTGDYARAALGMLASKWAGQVKGRAKRLAEQMRTGERA